MSKFRDNALKMNNFGIQSIVIKMKIGLLKFCVLPLVCLGIFPFLPEMSAQQTEVREVKKLQHLGQTHFDLGDALIDSATRAQEQLRLNDPLKWQELYAPGSEGGRPDPAIAKPAQNGVLQYPGKTESRPE